MLIKYNPANGAAKAVASFDTAERILAATRVPRRVMPMFTSSLGGGGSSWEFGEEEDGVGFVLLPLLFVEEAIVTKVK